MSIYQLWAQVASVTLSISVFAKIQQSGTEASVGQLRVT